MMQAKLLHSVEVGEIVRVGATRPTPIEVRFIAATHRDLATEVAAGRFRTDLYYRLDGVSLLIPPLRDRTDRIIPLAMEFVAAAQRQTIRCSAAFLARLEQHDWPGNVRELKATVERAVMLAAGADLTESHLIFSRRVAGLPLDQPDVAHANNELPRDAFAERTRIMEALRNCGGNQTRAARTLGVSRATLAARLVLYRIPRPRS
jgi:DNA-binding NtrC family response regulator